MKINKKKFIEVGDGEIIIFDNFYNNGGFIDYPMKSFENLNEYDNIFTSENGTFDIKYIEIFAFYLDENKFFYKLIVKLYYYIYNKICIFNIVRDNLFISYFIKNKIYYYISKME